MSMCIILNVAMNAYIDLRKTERQNGSFEFAEGRFTAIDKPHVDFECDIVENDGDYVLDCRYRVKMSLPCARCLRPTGYERTASIEIRCSQEMQEDIGEYYVQRIHRGRVDISEPISQDIELFLPMSPLCSKDCQGICSECGEYRPCNCKAEARGMLAGFEELLDKFKE